MYATNFWATDACKVWGKSRMRTTYIPDTRNSFLNQFGHQARNGKNQLKKVRRNKPKKTKKLTEKIMNRKSGAM